MDADGTLKAFQPRSPGSNSKPTLMPTSTTPQVQVERRQPGRAGVAAAADGAPGMHRGGAVQPQRGERERQEHRQRHRRQRGRVAGLQQHDEGGGDGDRGGGEHHRRAQRLA